VKQTISLNVNGVARTDDVEPRMLLVHYLRETLGLTGTHIGCDTSQCGACTVHLNGQAIKSCTILAAQADGATVTTIEGLAAAGGYEEGTHPLQTAFQEEHGLQRPPSSKRTPAQAKQRYGTAWKGTSAAAPATTTSSKRCVLPQVRRWRRYLTAERQCRPNYEVRIMNYEVS
jgi:hypothetical protein